MKAIPMILTTAFGYKECEPENATHLHLNFPSPAGRIIIPVMIGGTRQGTPNWTWNGDINSPTLKPSILTTNHKLRCHSFVNNGKVQFLDDCTHDLAGQTLDMLEVE